jgi:hypothetical protein
MTRALVLLLAAAGCSSSPLGTGDGGRVDLAARDLAATVDGAAPDLAGDAAAPDFAVDDAASDAAPDFALAVDLAFDQLGPCRGGYLNSDAGDACPLSCSPLVTPVADEGRFHVPFCTEVSYVADPPASGNHWPAPDTWGFHQEVVPREWWVHNLEHGGVVLLWNCPSQDAADPSPPLCNDAGIGEYFPADEGCPTEIIELQQIYSQQPPDNWFDQFTETRILLTADPLLPKRFAAVAWDWVWMADTLDVAAVKCFVAARYGRGPEVAP